MTKKLTDMFKGKDVYKPLFFVLVGLIAILLPVMSKDAGINGDEKYQVYIANNILDFYTSFGKNRNLFLTDDEIKDILQNEGKEKLKEMGVVGRPYVPGLRYYGGGFEFFSALFARIFGFKTDRELGFHVVRHVLLGFIGVLIILFTGLIAKQLYGWRAAVLAAIILFVSPRFFGQTIMNPKDIPFALGYVVAVYFMIRYFVQSPTPYPKILIGLIAGMAFAINVRIGGVMLLFYFVMFCGLYWIYHRYYKKDLTFNSHLLKKFVTRAVIVIIGGYFLGLVLWPYGLLDPISTPFNTLARFSQFPVNILQLFEGKQIRSQDLPWYYLPKYLIISNPFIFLIGFVLFLALINKLRKEINIGYLGIVAFMVFFPIAYIIYNKSNVYSGWRHILFVYPPMVVLAALGWERLIRLLKPVYAKAIVGVVIAILVILPLQWIFANHPYEYIYFNALVGGTKNAYTKYVTDYWQISIKDASEWLVKNVDPKKEIVVGTNCGYPARIYLQNYSENIKVKYVKYYQRSQKDWDYGFFYIDYVNPYQLEKKIYPPDQSVHVVRSSGVPLCAVVERKDKSDFEAFNALNAGNYNLAIQKFQQAIKTYPQNAEIYMGLGQAYLGVRNAQQAERAFKKYVSLKPDAQSYAVLGNFYKAVGDNAKANQYFNYARKLQ